MVEHHHREISHQRLKSQFARQISLPRQISICDFNILSYCPISLPNPCQAIASPNYNASPLLQSLLVAVGHVRGLWNYVKDDSLESSVVQPIRDFIISAQHQAVGSEAEEDDEEAEATEAAPLSNVVLACMRIEHSLENLEQRVRVMKDEWSNA